MLSANCLIAVDAMGGDLGPHLTVPAVVSTLKRYPSLKIQLFGDKALLSPYLSSVPSSLMNRLEIMHTDEVVTMDDKPAHAMRRKRESSMWQALETVKTGTANACVSAGNTGALMAMGMYLLGTLDGIERPAICTAMPTYTGKVYLLDMGANVGCSAAQLLQFALMASAMVSEVDGIEAPRVGLLNVGHEQNKGDSVVQQAAEHISAHPQLNYLGFAEGDAIFSGHFDIIVCDGFAGNVALKTSEGVARMIGVLLSHEIKQSLVSRLGALLLRKPLSHLQHTIDPTIYNGASLLGLQGVVIKSHGGTTQAGFSHALDVAIREVEKDVPSRIRALLS